MMLTLEQQRVVEENMRLVSQVIKDRVHTPGYAFSYEDLFQIGCIGLCKAVATDKGGCFSTYAYRLIWNEISTALVKATNISHYEYPRIDAGNYGLDVALDPVDLFDQSDLKMILEQVRARASGTVAKGIRCLELQVEGYSSEEIGERIGEKPGTARLWMTRGRRFLREQPEFKHYIKEVIA